mmetsp:Transcript_17264/g.51914  ORF Transcript_17264/g.51914 Transcript_17264/m.51914 type:complete len:247 (-) Transcript_17264:130-870(-)
MAWSGGSQGGGRTRSNRFEVRDPDCTVWLGNLPQDSAYQDVQSFMNQVGHCKHVEILRTGTGFAWFASAQEAAFAIAKLNGSDFKGSSIIVDIYNKKGGRTGGGSTSSEGTGRSWNNFGSGRTYDWKNAGGGSGVWKPMFHKNSGGMSKGMGKGTQNIAGKNRIRNPECTVWLGSLPEGILFKDVQEHMNQAGTCKFVATLRKGTGFAVMSTPEEARNAIEMLNGTELNGATIAVDVWEKKSPASS